MSRYGTDFSWYSADFSCFSAVTDVLGLATIPLSGIDVPFHSRYLWSGVIPFRACE